MRNDDVRILQEVQRNTKMAMKAIDTISEKIYDDDLSMHVARESMKYADIYNKATDRLLDGRAPSYRETGFEDIMLKGGVRANTMLNTSTSHIAELIIQESSRKISKLCQSLHKYENAGEEAVEMAREFMDFEESNIRQLRKFL